jgi:hypothetical protein
MPVSFPGGAEQREGLGGQGDGAIFGALAAMDMDLEALAVNGSDLEEEGVMEPQAQAIDGGQVALVVEGGGGGEEPLDLRHAEDGGQPVGELRTNEREGMPVAFEDVLIKEANPAVAEAHGRGGKVVDICAVQDIALEVLLGDAVGGFVGELGPQADCADRGFVCPFALATEVACRNHLLTQWGHEMSPFVRGGMDV